MSAACSGSAEGPSETTPSFTAASITQTPSPAIADDFEYEVQDGDTLFDIALRFGTSVEAIMAANRIDDPAGLSVGQRLIIRGATITPTPGPENPAGSGFVYPIEGACLPTDDYRMPNSPREYRAGIHEGVDFYSFDGCVDVPEDAPALAAKSGRVIRADHDYEPLTADELGELLARSLRQGYTDDEALDRFRGRQVWIDHGDGVVTRYCHLAGIPEDVREGEGVAQGELVGFVGDSGTPESVTDPGLEIHLHFEVRVGDTFLGEGLAPDQVRWLYQQVFSER